MIKVLTIAGSDSGGGAGIQADIKTIFTLGAYPLTVISALTAQNSQGVDSILKVPPDFVAAQMESVISDMSPHATKTGMLLNASILKAVVRTVERYRLPLLVVDPVILSSTGKVLLESNVINMLREQLLPLATFVTPNLHEAEILSGRKVGNLQEMVAAAKQIKEFGPETVIAWPSCLKALGKEIREKNRGGINLRFVFTGGELLDEHTRNFIRETFDAEVFDNYGVVNNLHGTFNNEGDFINEFVVYNEDDFLARLYNDGGIFNNNGSLSNYGFIFNDGIFTNDGILDNYYSLAASGMTGSGLFINNNTVNNMGGAVAKSGFTNNGVVNNSGDFDVSGTNNGTMNNFLRCSISALENHSVFHNILKRPFLE